MKHHGIYYLLLLTAFAQGSCKRPTERNPDLLGKWQGKEWLIFGKPSGQDATQVYFEFMPDGKYTAGSGSQNENGTWRTEKDKLYTTATDRKEIMVKMLKTDSTTLVFEMNRGGQQETLELIKVQ